MVERLVIIFIDADRLTKGVVLSKQILDFLMIFILKGEDYLPWEDTIVQAATIESDTDIFI